MSITKGRFPALRRASFVHLEINMKDGNMREFHADGNISVIALKLTLEGPIVKDKASFMVSARRTYLDPTVPSSPPRQQRPSVSTNPAYYFYDLNAKLNWRVGPNRVYFSAFSGKDDFGVESTETYDFDGVTERSTIDLGLDWRNQIQALRWNREIGPRMFWNATATHSVYNFNTGVDFSDELTENGETTVSLRVALPIRH